LLREPTVGHRTALMLYFGTCAAVQRLLWVVRIPPLTCLPSRLMLFWLNAIFWLLVHTYRRRRYSVQRTAIILVCASACAYTPLCLGLRITTLMLYFGTCAAVQRLLWVVRIPTLTCLPTVGLCYIFLRAPTVPYGTALNHFTREAWYSNCCRLHYSGCTHTHT
jgi:hypothetical protein